MSGARMQQIEDAIRRIGSEVASGLGLELVELSLGQAKNRLRVRLDIDRAGPTGVGIDDCQRVSEAVGARLEQEDLIPQSYVLEVSSPGIDRPIRTADDVRRNTGRRVVVETREPLEGQRSFRGLLVGLEGENVRLRRDGGEEVRVPMEVIVRARQEAPF